MSNTQDAHPSAQQLGITAVLETPEQRGYRAVLAAAPIGFNSFEQVTEDLIFDLLAFSADWKEHGHASPAAADEATRAIVTRALRRWEGHRAQVTR